MRAAWRPGACPMPAVRRRTQRIVPVPTVRRRTHESFRCPPRAADTRIALVSTVRRRTHELLRRPPQAADTRIAPVPTTGGGHANRSGVQPRAADTRIAPVPIVRRRTHESFRCPPSGGGQANRSGADRPAADTRIVPVSTASGGHTNRSGAHRERRTQRMPAPHGTGVVRPRYHPRCAAAPPSRPATPLTAPRRRARLTRASPVMALPLITVGAPAEPTGVGHRGSRSLARSVGGSGGIFARRGCTRLAPSRARLAAAGDGLLAPSQPVCRV